MRTSVVKTAIILLLVGVLLVALSVICRPTLNSAATLDNQRLLAESLEILGVALIVASILNGLIELKEWRTYFGERLSEIVMEQSYLKNLSPEKLKEMQLSVVKALYPRAGVEAEGSFWACPGFVDSCELAFRPYEVTP